MYFRVKVLYARMADLSLLPLKTSGSSGTFEYTVIQLKIGYTDTIKPNSEKMSAYQVELCIRISPL